MDIFLVGGAVRDELLNIPVYEKDWVVVGAKKHDLIELGYTQVGKNFPVFLHPKSKEEYALARTEKKIGKGYTGFICDFNENITLEEDLKRRDLTINAIAMDEDNNLIDPYHGVDDLNNRILRHVSSAFSEDPLRVLRVARFAARFHHLGFQVAKETMQLMKEISISGEINHLVPERIWKETEKALQTENPQRFFEILKECHALEILFPEINDLFNFSLSNSLVSDMNVGIHSLQSLKHSLALTKDADVRFAILCHHLNRIHHDKSSCNGTNFINQLCIRLKVPNYDKKIANILSQDYETVHNIKQLSSPDLINLLERIDAWRNPDNLNKLILGSLSDFYAYPGSENCEYSNDKYLNAVYSVAKSVPIKKILENGYKGIEIQNKLKENRIKAIHEWKIKQLIKTNSIEIKNKFFIKN